MEEFLQMLQKMGYKEAPVEIHSRLGSMEYVTEGLRNGTNIVLGSGVDGQEGATVIFEFDKNNKFMHHRIEK